MITDTQTGLRGIPRSLLPTLLRTPGAGYEFELEMLIVCKHSSLPIVEEKIRTIYLEGNASSHFNPVWDSLKIYFTLLRFGMVSIITALLDNAAFYLMLRYSFGLAPAQIVGRIVGLAFNYSAGRKAVFLSRASHRTVFPRYMLSVAVSGLTSYAVIRFLSSTIHLHLLPTKVLVESVLFLFNFAVQRDFVFMKRERNVVNTDWNHYYSSVPVTAKITRRYTGRILVSVLNRLNKAGESGPKRLAELGGANSCFIDSIMARTKPISYHVVDNNQFGLNLLKTRKIGCSNVVLHHADVLASPPSLQADVVFSVGLIEHFDPQGTRKAILAHFDLLREGGYAIISFPTPTILYRVTRFFAEFLHMWHFPDERPLSRSEVLRTISERGNVVFEKLLWPLFLTQRVIVARHDRPLR